METAPRQTTLYEFATDLARRTSGTAVYLDDSRAVVRVPGPAGPIDVILPGPGTSPSWRARCRRIADATVAAYCPERRATPDRYRQLDLFNEQPGLFD